LWFLKHLNDLENDVILMNPPFKGAADKSGIHPSPLTFNVPCETIIASN
jgi:hypothetical protein